MALNEAALTVIVARGRGRRHGGGRKHKRGRGHWCGPAKYAQSVSRLELFDGLTVAFENL